MIFSFIQIPDMTNYTMQGRTYRYFVGKPLYPFGYGLSYTNFTYRTLSVHPQNVFYGNPVMVETYVVNIGAYDGDEVCTNVTILGQIALLQIKLHHAKLSIRKNTTGTRQSKCHSGGRW